MAAARRYWFALMVCGVLLGLSLPLYLTPGRSCHRGPSAGDGMSVCAAPYSSPGGILDGYDLARPGWLQLYWLLALVAGGAAVGWWYRRAGRGRRAAGCVGAAVAWAAVTTGLTRADWTGIREPSGWASAAPLLDFNGATPLLAIGLALLALALAERSAVLLLLAAGYSALAYTFATRDSFGVLHDLGFPVDVMDDPWGIRQLLNLALPAGALLLAAAGAYAGSARSRRPVR